MSPQTGPDLVGAGYPIGNALSALMGGTMNSAQGNVPVKTNLNFGIGGSLIDSTVVGGSAGWVWSMAVPVVPGDVITKISLLPGATGIVTASVTNLWAALYTGTGSAPGTTGAQPSYIASATASSSGAGSIAAGVRLDFTLTSPQSITSVQAPFGYIYAAYSLTTSGSSATNPSLVAMTMASVAQYQYYTTSPYAYFMQSGSAAGGTAPANLGTATRVVNPPVVLLS